MTETAETVTNAADLKKSDDPTLMQMPTDYSRLCELVLAGTPVGDKTYFREDFSYRRSQDGIYVSAHNSEPVLVNLSTIQYDPVQAALQLVVKAIEQNLPGVYRPLNIHQIRREMSRLGMPINVKNPLYEEWRLMVKPQGKH